MATATPRPGDEAPRMSRYRSIRNARNNVESESQPPLPASSSTSRNEDTNLSRSRSRYKRPSRRQPTDASSELPAHKSPSLPIAAKKDSQNRASPAQRSQPTFLLPARTDTTSKEASLTPSAPPVALLKTSSSHSKLVSSPNGRAPVAGRQASSPLAGPHPKGIQIPLRPSGPAKTSSTPNLKHGALMHSASIPHRTHTDKYNGPWPGQKQALLNAPLVQSTPHSQTAMHEAKQMMDAEAERQRQLRRKMRAQKVAAEKEETDRRHRAQKLEQDMTNEANRQAEHRRKQELQTSASEQRRKEKIQQQDKRIQDEAQRQKHLASKLRGGPLKVKSLTDSNKSTPRPSVSRDVLGFWKKIKSDSEDTASSEGRQTTAPSSPERRQNGETPRGLLATGTPTTSVQPPGADAPVSAVNAGERRVIVACGKATMMFPVTPTTTPVDVIKTASTVMSEPIDYKASILLEDFGKVGVQRPLRNYEHIRDVLNSWDEDKQHNLVLIPSATGGNDPDLDVSSIPVEEPGPLSLWMYYSQKPGKWEKRWITLQQNGQVTLAKKETDNAKELINMCHMSDFDVYTPSAKTISKKIKPPKKHCFAMKSQQKSAMFESLENFVHFVCTGDKNTAAQWYNAVQGWRSWYLVNVLGEGVEKAREAGTGANAAQDSSDIAGSRDSHYQLGSFQPLLDLDLFAKRSSHVEASSPPSTETRNARPIQHTSNQLGRSSTQKAPSEWQHTKSHLTNDTSNDSGYSHAHTRGRSTSASAATHHRARSSTTNARQRDAAFAPKGLLGSDNYAQRQKAQRERENAGKDENPFTGGLLAEPDSGADGALAQSSSTDHVAIARGTLLDQVISDSNAQDATGASRGRAFIPTTIGSKGLIENATSSNALERSRTARHIRNRSSGPHAHTGPNSGPHHSSSNSHAREFSGRDADDVQLADGSLLAQAAAHGQIGKGASDNVHGRGIMQGTSAKGPMLDLRGESIFAGGSLLRQVEGANAGMPKAGEIDRSRDGEVSVKVGEAL